jgi:GT2 family glycosyltransferase
MTANVSKSLFSAGAGLSVVITVRNVARFQEASIASIASILRQTYADFKFIIRDDGSTDSSRLILRKWAAADRRIHLVESDKSLGPSGSSNYVVAVRGGFPTVGSHPLRGAARAADTARGGAGPS